MYSNCKLQKWLNNLRFSVFSEKFFTANSMQKQNLAQKVAKVFFIVEEMLNLSSP